MKQEYKLLSTSSPAVLSTDVTLALASGWELYGPPVIGDYNICFQAVTRRIYPDNPPPPPADWPASKL